METPTSTDMTTKQAETVEWLKKEIMRRDGHGEDYEFEIHPCGKLIAVVTVVGLKGDEGTAAELVRRHRQLFVGRRGGISALKRGTRRMTTVHGLKAFYV
jgi:hypothetical protein